MIFKNHDAMHLMKIFKSIKLTICTFGLVGCLNLNCYVGDWSKSGIVMEADCGEKYCGIILRQNGSELYSEANCYDKANFKSKWLKKILINLSDARLPNRVAFYVCHYDLCNRKSKYIHLKARYKSLRRKNQRLAILSVDDDDSKMILEHRANNFSLPGYGGSEIIGSESNFTFYYDHDRPGSKGVYQESTKVEQDGKDNSVKRYHHKSIFSEGLMDSNDKDLMFWKMFQ